MHGRSVYSGVPRGGGGQGGHGPRAQALEGAPAQLVGPNCKKKSRPRQISRVSSLQSAVADAGFNKRGGGGRRCKHWPPSAGDPRYATGYFYWPFIYTYTVARDSIANQSAAHMYTCTTFKSYDLWDANTYDSKSGHVNTILVDYGLTYCIIALCTELLGCYARLNKSGFILHGH